MEIYQLRTFTAVAEFGSLARATERLHISLPAASGHIKALEEEFGVALFERRPNGLVLTRTGLALLPQAQLLLATARDLSERAKELRGQVGGHLRFGAVFDPDLLRLGELMSRLVARHPMLGIEIHHTNSRSIAAGISKGDLDIGLALGEGEIQGINTLVLQRLRYRIVAPVEWADRVRPRDWNTVAKLPWISTPKDGSHYRMAESIFRRYRFTPAKVIEADSESIISSLVFGGVGLGLMREDLAYQACTDSRAVVLEDGEAFTNLRLLYPTTREADPSIKAVREIIQQLWPASS